MPIQRRTAIAMGVLVVAALFCGWLLMRNAPGPNPSTVRAELQEALADDFSASRAVPLAETEAVQQALAAAPHGPPQGFEEGKGLFPDATTWDPGPGAITALHQHVSQWLGLLSNADADEYLRWMRSRGYQFPDQTPDGALDAYGFLTGPPAETDISRESLFKTLFQEVLSYGGGQLRPVEMATSEFSRRVRFLQVEERDTPRTAAFLTRGQKQRWIGMSSMSTRRHFEPPVTFEDVRSREGGVPTAIVSVAVRTQTDQWVPLNIFLFYDSGASEWHIFHVAIVNADFLHVGLEY